MNEKLNTIKDFLIGFIVLIIMVIILVGLSHLWKTYGGWIFFGVPTLAAVTIWFMLNFVKICIEIGEEVSQELVNLFHFLKRKIKKE